MFLQKTGTEAQRIEKTERINWGPYNNSFSPLRYYDTNYVLDSSDQHPQLRLRRLPMRQILLLLLLWPTLLVTIIMAAALGLIVPRRFIKIRLRKEQIGFYCG